MKFLNSRAKVLILVFLIISMLTIFILHKKNSEIDKVVIPSMGEVIENSDGSKVALGKVIGIEENSIYLELGSKTLLFKTNEKTLYSIAYSQVGQPEIIKSSFNDIRIGNTVSVTFLELGVGDFVSEYIVINK